MKPVSFEQKLKRKTRGIAWISALLGYCVTLASLGALFYFLGLIAYYLPRILFIQVKGELLLGLLAGIPILIAIALFIASRRDARRLTRVFEKRYPNLRD